MGIYNSSLPGSGAGRDGTPEQLPSTAPEAAGAERLPLVLDTGDTTPFYQQVAEQIRRLVLTGRLPPGALLPSVRALALQLSTSVITTRRAYDELERAGLIVTRQGAGSFVACLAPDERVREREGQVRAQLEEAIRRGLALGVPADRIAHLVQEILQQREDGTR